MESLKKQLRFHYIYTRSTLAWFISAATLGYILLVIGNFTSESTCFGNCTWDEFSTMTITSIAGLFWVTFFIFQFINIVATFNERFRVSINFGSTRRGFYKGILGYYCLISLALTGMATFYLVLDRIFLPLLNDAPFTYSIPFPTVYDYFTQIIYGFGVLLFISSVANLFGILYSLIGKGIYFIVAGLYILLILLVNNQILSRMNQFMFYEPNLLMQMIKFIGISAILFGIGWLIVSRLELKR